MEFTINSNELLTAVQTVARAQQSKNALPILDYIRVELTDEGLDLMASDSEQTLSMTIPVQEASGVGQCMCIPSKSIIAALKELSNQPVTMTMDESTYACKMKYANGEFKFVGQSALGFPMPSASPEDASSFTLPAQAIITGIENARCSMASDDLRPQMCGVYADIFNDGHACFVSSDGHSLVKTTFMGISTSEEPVNFIIPAKTANILSAVLPKEGDVDVAINGTNMILRTEKCVLYSRLVDGRFPNYNSVIPESSRYEAVVERDALIGALRRVSLCAAVNVHLIRFSFADGRLVLSADDKDFNTSGTESIPCDYCDSPFLIGLSSTIMMKLLRSFPPAELRFAFEDPTRAVVVTLAEVPEDEQLLALAMPLMLKD